jgi:helix-turn-helix protein
MNTFRLNILMERLIARNMSNKVEQRYFQDLKNVGQAHALGSVKFMNIRSLSTTRRGQEHTL